MLQRLPRKESMAPNGKIDEAWKKHRDLVQKIKPITLYQNCISPFSVLFELFNGDNIRVYEAKNLCAKCSCSKERVELVLAALPNEEIESLKLVSHLSAKSLNQQMVNANVVISRSGYSTVMDIAKLNKKAIFVPTPGQTEQLYLAKYFYDKNKAFAMHQKDFNLKNALIRSSEFNGFKAKSDDTDWKNIFEVFNKISNLA